MNSNTAWQQPGASEGSEPKPVQPANPQQAFPQARSPQQPYGQQQYPQPGYAPQYGQAQYQAQYQAPGYGPAYGPGSQAWTAPVKPGLIPLRPMGTGAIIGASFQMLRRNPRTTFGTALLIELVITLLSIAIGAIGLWFVYDAIDLGNANPANWLVNSQEITTSITLTALATFLPALISIFGIVILQGVLVISVAREALGEKINLRGLFQLAKGRIRTLLLWGLILLLVVVVALGLYVLVLLPVILMGSAGAGLTGILLFFFVVIMLVFGIWIGFKLSLVAPAIMLEKMTVRQAIKRSWSLTNKNFWRAAGPQLLVSIILSFVSQIVSAPLSFLLVIVISMMAPLGGGVMDGGMVTLLIVFALITIVVGLIVAAITLVAQTASTALVYLDLRMRKEGLDLEMVRYVENKQSGVQDNPDPYLSAPNPGYAYQGTTQYSAAQYQQAQYQQQPQYQQPSYPQAQYPQAAYPQAQPAPAPYPYLQYPNPHAPAPGQQNQQQGYPAAAAPIPNEYLEPSPAPEFTTPYSGDYQLPKPINPINQGDNDGPTPPKAKKKS
ncbi:MAG: glycerophosphoryl diester phosphodiesterase membrane domain-containing protein [Microbacteriaceae bacterium]